MHWEQQRRRSVLGARSSGRVRSPLTWLACWAAASLAGAISGCNSDPPRPRNGVGSLEPAPNAESPADPSAAAVTPEPPPAPPPPAEPPVLDESSGGPISAEFPEDDTPPGELAPEDSCAATAIEAETIERVVEVPVEEEVVVPSVFYLMLDSSGSMVTDPLTLESLVEDLLDLFGLGTQPPQPTKWDYTVAGLKSFINDPASAGIELALGYFPDAGQCDGSGYDQPSVALGALPESAPLFEASLDARQPAGNTPLEGALRGATNFCLGFNAEHPEASCVAVLITDGAADECDARSATDLAAIAANARAGGVITYAAGMQGADFSVLDAIGAAGGGDCDPASAGFACDLTANQQAFVAALNTIRDRTRTQTRIERHTETQRQALPCAWQIPVPPSGAALDPARVNVRLSQPDGSSLSLPSVVAAPDCGANAGWYYDDALAPSRVLACPATCDALGVAPETRVDLLFGCKTVLR